MSYLEIKIENEIKIKWDDELYFINKNVELPFEEVLFYTPIKTA
jgi:hypothetical protein